MKKEDIFDEVCRICMNEEPNKTCNYYVQRMVGECHVQEIKEIQAMDGKKYKVSCGVYFYPNTPNRLIDLLNHLYVINERLRFHWGDMNTGLDWGDDYGVAGRLGITTGKIKMLILVHNKRSRGGHTILTDHIVRIDWANKKGHGDHRTAYCSRFYHTKQDEFDLYGDKDVDTEALKQKILEKRIHMGGPSVKDPEWEFRDTSVYHGRL